MKWNDVLMTIWRIWKCSGCYLKLLALLDNFSKFFIFCFVKHNLRGGGGEINTIIKLTHKTRYIIYILFLLNHKNNISKKSIKKKYKKKECLKIWTNERSENAKKKIKKRAHEVEKRHPEPSLPPQQKKSPEKIRKKRYNLCSRANRITENRRKQNKNEGVFHFFMLFLLIVI